MADETTITNPAPAPANAAPAPFAMPDKFAGKSAEDIARSYVELESQLGKYSGHKDYDEVIKAFPGKGKEVLETINWAKQKFEELRRGDYVPRSELDKLRQTAAPVGDPEVAREPWKQEGWEMLPPADQSRFMTEYMGQQLKTMLEGEVKKYADQYGALINGNIQGLSRQQQLLLRVLEAKAENPKLSVDRILTEAASLANEPSEKLLNRVIENMLKPSNADAEVDQRVNAKLAELKQNEQNKQLGLLNGTGLKPRWGAGVAANGKAVTGAARKESENRQIMESLSKLGIHIS